MWRIRSVSEYVGERGGTVGRQYGPAGSGCRGTVKSQFYPVATQSVEKPCILIDSRLGSGRGTAEEMQLRMATKGKVSMFSAALGKLLLSEIMALCQSLCTGGYLALRCSPQEEHAASSVLTRLFWWLIGIPEPSVCG